MTRRELLALAACGLSRIEETTIELSPRRVLKTLCYNGQVPGPLLRVKEGRPLTVDVWNDTRDEEFVHWHGLHIPSEVDGAREEGTPPVPLRGGHAVTSSSRNHPALAVSQPWHGRSRSQADDV